MISNEDKIRHVNSLSKIDKLKVYMEYYIGCLAEKYRFDVVDKMSFDIKTINPDWMKGRNYPYKQTESLAFFRIFGNVNISSFEEFISEDNIERMDFGERWREKGYASRYRTELHGIYEMRMPC